MLCLLSAQHCQFGYFNSSDVGTVIKSGPLLTLQIRKLKYKEVKHFSKIVKPQRQAENQSWPAGSTAHQAPNLCHTWHVPCMAASWSLQKDVTMKWRKSDTLVQQVAYSKATLSGFARITPSIAAGEPHSLAKLRT